MIHNQDTAELNHFNQLAQHWWDKNGPLKTLHDINPARLSFVQKHQPLAGLRVLDIGCGAGIFSEALAKAGAQVTGIDLASDLIDVAKQHSQLANMSIDYQCISAETFAEQHPQSFDVVVCMELLEHVPDPAAILQAAAHCLAPEGWLFASTINQTFKAKALAVWTAEYVLNLIPKGTHDADKFIAPHQLVAWTEPLGLTAVQLMGLHYHPFKRTTHLALPADVNYLMAFHKTT
jgi:2-polyprenyl-6-hydroxyphenyl methylase/3-demethylubiquinone-9 3-methyltransferase